MATSFFVPRYALRSVLDSTKKRRAQLRPQWLDGMSDVLADSLRGFGKYTPPATAKIRPDSMPTADYRPSLFSPWPAADEALAQGLPIATGVIEGACRHLVKTGWTSPGRVGVWREPKPF